MPNTRGNLEAARIYVVDEDGNEQDGGDSVSCMFNPFEYTVAKTNQFHEEPANDDEGQNNSPHGFGRADAVEGPQPRGQKV